MRRLLLACALAFAVAAPASAQPGPGPHRRAPKANKRDKVKERIRAMRAWVLTEQLDLDAATAEKMFPVLARHDDELAKLLGERKRLRAELLAARKGNAGRAAIDPLLDKLVANQRARWAAEEQRFADLRTMLTAEQAADLLDLLPEVDRKILRGLRDAIERGAAAPTADDWGPRTGGDLTNPFDSRK
jgi:Spy/CpxP family protein refolding chaperone